MADGPLVRLLREQGGRQAPRLGRHVEHDPASVRYAAVAWPKSALRSARWQREVPPFDQGADITVDGVEYHGLGSCVGNAAAGWIATANKWRPGLPKFAGGPVDERLAVLLYSTATGLDRVPGKFPTEDTGSSGLGGAKALKRIGAASGYRHAFSLRAALTGLQYGPLLAGVPWYQSMFTPDRDGRVRVDPASGLAGGHELCVDELDLDKGRVGFTQSWGDWGVGGRGWLALPDFQALLADGGDVTIPVTALAEGAGE